jgi:hypothetical protein
MIGSILLASCSLFPLSESPSKSTQNDIPETLIKFEVTLPAALQPGESIILTILDEVSGLQFNQKLTPMQAQDALHYTATLQIRVGSVIKYRYLRQGTYIVQEHLPNGQPVRYRMYYVTTQAAISDQISRWTDTTYIGNSGRIYGTVTDTQTNQPIPNLLVTAGGLQTITGADGAYLLEELSPGTHNLVIYAQDGGYQTFQQGAAVAPGASTPANISLAPSKFVDITFIVSAPANTIVEAPLRLAGNLIQLGNTFTDLSGGVSTLAARMPIMSVLADERRSITLSLPVGADLRYKYTLGDGIWNAEFNSGGALEVRQMIIPEQALTIEDQVFSWAPTGPAPVTFRVNPPAVLPGGDNLSIQFNPGYGWLEPLPMWQQPDSSWSFTLISPLQSLDTIHYRYCRNEQCGSADDNETAGPVDAGRILTLLYQSQVITDTITAWNWLPALSGPATVPNLAVNPRKDFIAGVALQSSYHPSWLPHVSQTIKYIQSTHANWLILSPTWSYAKDGKPLLISDPAQDMPEHDFRVSAQAVLQSGLELGVYPQINFENTPEAYWAASPGDYAWWVSWFDRYRAFALHHAQLAQSNGAGMLILGGQDIMPAIPRSDGDQSHPNGLPIDAIKWWSDLIADVRQVYKGAVGWAIAFPEGLETDIALLNQVDLFYVEWSAPLDEDPLTNEPDLSPNAARLLDTTLLPFMRLTQKPAVLALTYPSAEGVLTGCLQAQEGSCLNSHQLERPNPDYPSISLSLEQQTNAYNAILQAVNDRPWIGGIVSAGFYPPAMLQDKSASVYGKPAAGALWYWFGEILGR